MAAIFSLGNQQLPPSLAKLALTICEQANLSHSEFFYKWEAWAINNNKSSDLPTETDLNQLADYIRQSAIQKPSHTPTKSTARNSIYSEPSPAPIKVSVDDFFSYIDNEPDENIQSTPKKEEQILQPDSHTPDNSDLQHAPHNNNHNPSSAMNIDTLPHPPADEDEIIHRSLTLPDDDKPDKLYAERDGVGRIEVSHNGDLKLPTQTNRPTITLRQLNPTNDLDKQSVPKYMDDNAANRIEAVRAHVQQLGEDILLRQQRVDSADAPAVCSDGFADASAQRVRLVGRIRVELDETDGALAGRINPNAVMLEGEDGQIVKMDLGRLRESNTPVFLAPGMIVVVEGVKHSRGVIDVYALYDNGMGLPGLVEEKEKRRMKTSVGNDMENVEKITDKNNENEMDSEMKQEKEEDLIEGDTDEILPDANPSNDNQPYANMIVAAGPFTTATNLKYEPLEELLTLIERRKPDIALLIGPFVDERHSSIGKFTAASFTEIFERRVLERVVRTANSCNTQIALIPSLHDVHHELVCPQPSFRWGERSARSSAVHLIGNPAVLEVCTGHGNDRWCASIGVTSLPTIQDLSGDCVSWGRNDRFAAIVSHMVRQKSFYPLFPPSRNVPLDSSLLQRLSIPQMDTTPTLDVMVAPSMLKSFVKCVDGGAIAVNPGLLCRGSGGGTFAELAVPLHLADRPRSLNMNEDRLQGNIVRL